MKTQTVDRTDRMGAAVPRNSTVRKALLACGILSTMLYIAMNILGAMNYPGYSSITQSVSEMFAIGAPSAPLVVPMMVLYGLLIYSFGWGIWKSAGQNRALRAVAVLVAGKEVFGLLCTLFFPMHIRGSEETITDTMHFILTLVGVFLCMFPALMFGAAALGKRFRLYSIATILVFLTCGVLTFLDGPSMAANQPTQWMGVLERVNIFAYMLWIVVLSITLLRAQPDSAGKIRLEAAANRG